MTNISMTTSDDEVLSQETSYDIIPSQQAHRGGPRNPASSRAAHAAAAPSEPAERPALPARGEGRGVGASVQQLTVAGAAAP